MPFCAYIHAKPTGEIFYVGKGTHARAHNLNPRHRNKWHGRIVNKHGSKTISIGTIDCSSEETAFSLEIGLIKCLRRMGVQLVNQTDGGQGQSGRLQSVAERQKKADKLRGIPRPLHVRTAISEANKGKTPSIETRSKLSAIFKARPLHPNFIAAHKLDRTGAKNPHAKAVVGEHPQIGIMQFETMSKAAEFVNGYVSKVSKAAKASTPYKGWMFTYIEQV